LSEDEFLGLQSFLLQYPEAGKIVPGSGGIRKVRWAIAGKGKSGGVRVIYFIKRKEFCDRSQRKSKMTKRDIGQEILEGIREIKAHKAGKISLRTHMFTEPAPPQVIRAKLKLSQSAFAGLMGVSLRTVQDWEQGRRRPSGPAIALLRIAEQKPEIFADLS
jgi:putative transcriptional regulator